MTANEIAYRAAIQMYLEQQDAETFLQTIVVLCLRDNEHARELIERLLHLKRENQRYTTPIRTI
jgi:hypothetical protein